jgi:hypothetical protein
MSDIQKLEKHSVEDLLRELKTRKASSKANLKEYDEASIANALKSNQKVIYGTDDRADVFQLPSGPNLDDVDSVVALFRRGDITDNGNGTSTLQTQNFGIARNLCTGERFRDQPTGAFCSGFLVAPNIIATAGHCVDANNVANTRFVFGFRMRDATTAETIINNGEIYSGVAVIGRQLDGNGADWSLVRIDRSVPNHRIARIRLTGQIGDTQALHVIGHPSGLPTKFAAGAAVRNNQPNAFFVANLDTYGGNSGSPVFNNDTHEVEGILVRGETDFVSQGNCNVSLVCPTSGCRGEDCTRTTEFAHLIRQPELVVQNFGYSAGGWRVDMHPRFLADLTGDGRADIVGFGNAGVWVSLNNGDGTFQAPQMVVANFGYNAGGWRVERHPRFLADITGDGRADIVGFGYAGVWVALNNGNATFQTPQKVVSSFGYGAGGWRVERHPRFLSDLTGDGRADIVGFGYAGIWVALNNGNGTFQAPQMVVASFGYGAGGWRVERHPRFLADLTGDGRADIVGFGNAGVWVALNNGNGTFQAPQMVVASFGYNAGGWRVQNHSRFLADLTGDGRADIVGFGNAGVWVALNNGNGTFQAPQMVVASFGYNAGGWRVERHPRFLADLTGDGRADVVGFGNAGVWVALNNGNGTFQAPQMVVANFGYDAGGWRVERHPRFLAELTGDGREDIIGFGNAWVWIARSPL